MKKVKYGPNRYGNIEYPDPRKIFGKPRQVGCAKIDFFEVDRHGSMMAFLHDRERVYEGRYARLLINGKTVMSNTYMEEISCRPFLRHAHGFVLNAGLGMAHTLLPVLAKPEVKFVLTVEKNPDVISLVWPFVKKSPFGGKADIVCSDIFDLEGGRSWNTIWFDIWPNRSIDNLADMTKLHRRWWRSLDRKDPDRWMGSWMQKELQARRRAENRSSWPIYGALGGNPLRPLYDDGNGVKL